MHFFRAIACVALVGVAAPVSAQDTSTDPDWTGFYAGGQLEIAAVNMSTPGGVTLNEGAGAMIGAMGGYRYDLGSVVMGATGSVLLGNVNAAPLVAAATPDPTLDMVFRAGIELGYDLGPVLVTGGVGQTFAVMTNAANSRQSEFGSYFGIGADVMLNDNIMVGADITRTNLDNFAGQDVSVTSFGIGAAYRF